MSWELTLYDTLFISSRKHDKDLNLKLHSHSKETRENTEGAIRNGQYRETGSI
jgi:hypothetical protein